MLKRIIWLFLATLTGGLIGIAVTVFYLRGWFSPWRSVDSPPVGVVKLMALDESNLWVSGDDGKIYFNPAADTCTQACWTVVEEIERRPVPSERGALTESCLPPPPLTGMHEKIGECKIGDWQDQNTVYALRTDGSIRVWRFTSGGEWSVVMVMMAAIIGASIFFALSLTIIVFKAIIDSARKSSAPNM